MAVSRRSGDEIHPWLLNGDLRPKDVIRVSMFKRLVADRIADISIPISQRPPLAKATFEHFAASI